MKRAGCSVTSFKELKKALESVRERRAEEGIGLAHDDARRCPSADRATADTVRSAAVDCDSGVPHDEELFQEAMADVREIREFREIPFDVRPRIPVRAAKTEDDGLTALTDIVSGRRRVNICDTGEYIEWRRPRTRKDVTERLHRGQFSVQDFIDLHGMCLTEAEEALDAFFKGAVSKGYSCVKVIHGRGLRSPRGPVLKEAVQNWLQGAFRKWVLAYATAKDCDGGLGATYVILKPR
ncbi:MAG: Smr/MutS family protein [Chloroflexota bacterium]